MPPVVGLTPIMPSVAVEQTQVQDVFAPTLQS